jgi:hypothetical protein
MFIILTRDEFMMYEIVSNHLGKPKMFKNEDEAYYYGHVMELCPFQIIQVNI